MRAWLVTVWSVDEATGKHAFGVIEVGARDERGAKAEAEAMGYMPHKAAPVEVVWSGVSYAERGEQ